MSQTTDRNRQHTNAPHPKAEKPTTHSGEHKKAGPATHSNKLPAAPLHKAKINQKASLGEHTDSVPSLDSRKQFWERVFSRDHNNDVVLHHRDKPSVVFAVVTIPPDADRAQAAKLVSDAKAKVIKEHPKLSPGLTRKQGGMKERMAEAIKNYEEHRPMIERVFREEGVDIKYSRLPLFESSMNRDVVSGAGAGGIWQLMPGTAKAMGVPMQKEVVDARRDPEESTRAAAKLIKQNLEEFHGNEALAVTAYNTGPGILKAAIKSAGLSLDNFSKADFEKLISQDRGENFKFASRNYYAEALAAEAVYVNREKRFPGIIHEAAARAEQGAILTERIITREPMSYGRAQFLSGLNPSEFKERNPALLPKVTTGNTPIPANVPLNVRDTNKEAVVSLSRHPIPRHFAVVTTGKEQSLYTLQQTSGFDSSDFVALNAPLMKYNVNETMVPAGTNIRVAPGNAAMFQLHYGKEWPSGIALARDAAFYLAPMSIKRWLLDKGLPYTERRADPERLGGDK